MQPHRVPFIPTEHEIRHEAYRLWEAQGRPAGRDVEIWLAAKERLKHALPRPGRDHFRPRNAAHRPRDAQPAEPVAR